MTTRSRRRRGVVLLCLSVACGGLAASQVRSRAQRIEAQVGQLVPVLVAREELSLGTRLGSKTASRSLTVRQVPQRFVPADSLSSTEEAVGLRTAAPVPAGSYVTAAHLRLGDGGEPGGAAPGRGQRAVDLSVAGGEALSAAAGQQAKVDVLVTTDPGSASGRTYVALEDVELLGLRPAGGAQGGGAEGAGGDTVATLLVTARQAVFLTSAQNFAREIRLLLRPPGDRRRLGPSSVEAGAL